MKKSVAFKKLIDIKREFIEKIKPSDMKEHNGKNFTRKRCLTIMRLIILILRCSPFCLQIRLDDFFAKIGHKEEVVSKQALSKARTYLDPEILKSSFKSTANVLSSCEDLDLFRGEYRICAFDGSDLALDNAAPLLEHFGGSGPNKDCSMAMASLCYDPLNNIILDAGLYPYGTGERYAAKKHFEAVSELPLPEGAKNLYIADRGYPSKELFAEMIDNNILFFMRVREKFDGKFDAVAKKSKVRFEYNGRKYRVIVFNVTLSSGEKEILVTNLPSHCVSYKEAADLYFKRWNIEVKFDSLKNKLELENMSGRRVVTTYQDFWVELDLANTLAALEYSTDEVIAKKTSESKNKHQQRTNENRLITKFSDKYIDLLTNENTDERLAAFNELVEDISKRPVEVKPGRQSLRKNPRKKKFCDRRKRVLR